MNVHESMMDELVDENKFKQCSPEQVEAWIMVSPAHQPSQVIHDNNSLLQGAFLFAAVWSLGATGDEKSRNAFDSLIRELSLVSIQ